MISVIDMIQVDIMKTINIDPYKFMKYRDLVNVAEHNRMYSLISHPFFIGCNKDPRSIIRSRMYGTLTQEERKRK